MDDAIDNMISHSRQCQTHLPSHSKETMKAKPRPSRPFEELAADFCFYGGQCYLIIFDCYTDWPTIAPMGKNQDFAAQWKFKHQTSSPHYPQSNRKAEATVKSMKIIRMVWNGRFLDGDKLCKASLQYRNTPSSRNGLSPAKKLYGRPVQDTLPAYPKLFDSQQQPKLEEAAKKVERTQQTVIQYYNRATHPLPEFHAGTQVALQDPQTMLWDRYGEVIRVGQHRRYVIKMESGQLITRNRKFLWRRVPTAGQPHPGAPLLAVQRGPNVNMLEGQLSSEQQHGSSVQHQSRRSGQLRKPTQRLIEGSQWNIDH